MCKQRYLTGGKLQRAKTRLGETNLTMAKQSE